MSQTPHRAIADDQLNLSLMMARGLMRSACDHVEAVERQIGSGDYDEALGTLQTGAARRLRDAFEQLAQVAERLRELGATPSVNDGTETRSPSEAQPPAGRANRPRGVE